MLWFISKLLGLASFICLMAGIGWYCYLLEHRTCLPKWSNKVSIFLLGISIVTLVATVVVSVMQYYELMLWYESRDAFYGRL